MVLTGWTLYQQCNSNTTFNLIYDTADYMHLRTLIFCFLRWDAWDFKVSGGIETKGIHIITDAQISVFVSFRDTAYPYLQDETEIESVSSTQTSFYIVNHIDSIDFCGSAYTEQYFGISASQDGTLVKITSAETKQFLTLNLHDTYSEIAEDNRVDFSGFHVSSSAPVTLLSGKICAENTVANPAVSGSYISSHRPVDQYSTEFIVPVISLPLGSGYDVHVVASRNNTVVDIDSDVHHLDEGEVIISQCPHRVTAASVFCSLPCNVVQFSKGLWAYDGLFMISVLPTEDFYSSAVFTTSQSNGPFYITVVVDSPTAVTDIMLDGSSFSPVWTVFGNYTYAQELVSQGYHGMTSTDSRFAVYTFSHTGYNAGGYGYAVLSKEGRGWINRDLNLKLC